MTAPSSFVAVAAPTGNATTDTANIQNAITGLGSAGGTVVLQVGYYALSALGITVSAPVRRCAWWAKVR
ncbi:polygalacturonase [Mycobacterium sp. MAA66]|uniref:hypothetical protein n=1 Tax=Mycobacterium sp. MAA66 TaxID=3156297 RepID=UPI0035185B1E